VIPSDRDYVTLFLPLLVEHALSLGGLGRIEEARAELEQQLAELTPSQHPLALGQVHEALARIHAQSGCREPFEQHAREMERWFRATRSPALVARCEPIHELRLTFPEARAEARRALSGAPVEARGAAGEQNENAEPMIASRGSSQTKAATPRRPPTA
jgi:hypothetical protein